MHCRGFDPTLRRISPVWRIFPLELKWVLTPFHKNSFGWEYKPRSSLCTRAFPRTDSKDSDICPRLVNAHSKNTPSMHHPWRWNVVTSMVGLQKTITYAKISPQKWWTPEIQLGNKNKKIPTFPVTCTAVAKLLVLQQLSCQMSIKADLGQC